MNGKTAFCHVTPIVFGIFSAILMLIRIFVLLDVHFLFDLIPDVIGNAIVIAVVFATPFVFLTAFLIGRNLCFQKKRKLLIRSLWIFSLSVWGYLIYFLFFISIESIPHSKETVIREKKCVQGDLPLASGTFLNLNGKFTLHINSLSAAINPVDVRVLIDNELVVSEYISRTGDQYEDFRHVKMSLPQGDHHIAIGSNLGATTNMFDFVISNQNAGIIGFWFSPEHEQTNAYFSFSTFEGDLMLD